MTTPAQFYHTKQTHFLRRQVAFNSVATHSVSRHSMGVIPAGSQIVYCLGTVKTGFSAAGTRVLTVGSNGTTANNILTTITEETATAVMPLIGAKLTFSSDTEVFVKLTTAGTAAAAGLAEIVLGYAPAAAT
jgi:hypothetical protein